MNHRTKRWKVGLIDLDGTLYRGATAITGAAGFVRRLRDNGVQPVFFTNNAMRSPVSVVQQLDKLRIDAHPHEVCTSAQAAADYLHRTVHSGYVLTIGGDGLQEALREEGLQPLSIRHPKIQQRVGEVSGAVVGLDLHVTYAELDLFCTVAARIGSFTLTNGDVQLPTETGFKPGCGAIGMFVATATRLTPYVAGKPNPAFVRYALERFHANPHEAFIVGDNITTDIAAGVAAGVYTIQVLSGVMDPDASATASQTGIADEVVQSVADLFCESVQKNG